jgi:glycine/D-amino acid oxidase-like deaminating enzyme
LPEVVVVGGGIVGLSAAWSLRRAGAGSVTLLEKGVCGQGSTAKATGGVRVQFGSEVNVRLSLVSLRYFRDWSEIHGGDVGYRPIGYLFLATSPEHLEAQARGAAVQRSCGARVQLLAAAEVVRRVPGMEASDVLGASFGPDDGLADPGAAVASLVSSCRRTGVVIEEGLAVTDLVVESGGVAGVLTGSGRVVADTVVVAAGPWSPPLLASAGFDLPVTPRHRQVYRAGGVDGLSSRCPFVVDLGTGVYFHPDGPGLVFGGGDRDGSPGYDERFRSEEAPRIIELLSRRLPQVLEARLLGGWAGVRDMTPDDLGVLGPVPAVDGLLVATGFSGHGFMHAPAVGEELARLALGRQTEIDVSPLSPSRFGAGLQAESYVF